MMLNNGLLMEIISKDNYDVITENGGDTIVHAQSKAQQRAIVRVVGSMASNSRLNYARITGAG